MTAAGTSTGSAGSSPLARGLRPVAGHRRIHLRIIPARAGFTVCLELTKSRHRDHPRSRGVYINAFNYGTSNTGSSPLARGLRTKIPFLGDATGIIPARAGFTTHEHRPDGCAADHPRSRGVYAGLDAEEMEVVGSSPLARGLRVPIHPGRLGGRIIPARAGFTGTSPASSAPQADHPRSRGVYADWMR